MTGSGIVLLAVDRATGRVISATMQPSTGQPILDRAALDAFRKWVFKPGTVTFVRTPITFTTGGPPTYELHTEAKEMDDVLAAFLGKGTIVDGPIPAYPRFPPWTNKNGSGVYELHVTRGGTVSLVKILKSSGDTTFDRRAVATLGKWRLRKGPLILELPLSFRLTPTTYSVDIPRKH